MHLPLKPLSSTGQPALQTAQVTLFTLIIISLTISGVKSFLSAFPFDNRRGSDYQATGTNKALTMAVPLQ